MTSKLGKNDKITVFIRGGSVHQGVIVGKSSKGGMRAQLSEKWSDGSCVYVEPIFAHEEGTLWQRGWSVDARDALLAVGAMDAPPARPTSGPFPGLGKALMHGASAAAGAFMRSADLRTAAVAGLIAIVPALMTRKDRDGDKS